MLEKRYHSNSCGSVDQTEWLDSPEIDIAIEDALATVDQDERFKKYAEIQHMLVDLTPTIWLADDALELAYQASYLVWPIVEHIKAGDPISTTIEYIYYVHDMKIFPEKKADLLKK